jgi:hypothetical protein
MTPNASLVVIRMFRSDPWLSLYCLRIQAGEGTVSLKEAKPHLNRHSGDDIRRPTWRQRAVRANVAVNIDFPTRLQINVWSLLTWREGIWGVQSVVDALWIGDVSSREPTQFASFHALLRRLSAEGNFHLILESALSKVSAPTVRLSVTVPLPVPAATRRKWLSGVTVGSRAARSPHACAW